MRASAPTIVVTLSLVVVALTAGSMACSNSPTGPSPGPGPGPGPPPQTAVLIGAGDIGQCGSPGPALTASIVDANAGAVFIAGDIAYPHGSERNFAECFDPTWGRFRPRWRPVPGNHEYETAGADAYFRYFGGAAGPDRGGYYSFHAGNWLVLMLNSNVPLDRASAQFDFLDDTLDSDERQCTLAIWHHPLFSSGQNGPNPFMREAWRELYSENADVVVNAHDHLYERFAPQDPDGRGDVARGIRQFIAGAGGAQLYNFVRVAPNSETRIKAFGVLKLTLEPSSYRWEFIEGDGAVTDRGSGVCH